MAVATGGQSWRDFEPYWRKAEKETEARRRLEAAAPDLLAACEAALKFFSAEPGTVLYTAETWLALRNLLRAAVAKARGEQS